MALHIKKAGILSEILSHIYDLANSHKGKSQKNFRSKLGFCPNQLDPKFQPKELERLRPGPRAQIHLDATRGLSRKAGKQVACRNPPSSHCHLYWLLRY